MRFQSVTYNLMLQHCVKRENNGTMKKNLLLMLLFVSLSACENQINPAITADFLVKQIISESGDQRQVKDFTYSNNGKLRSVIHDLNTNEGANEYVETTNFLYDNEQLIFKTFSYQSTNVLHRQDSITYFGNGLIDKLYTAYSENGTMTVSWINEFEYNDDGTTKQRTSYNPTSPDTELSNRYYWSNGNIIKTEHYYQDALRYEASYQYDGASNYKLGNPFFSDFEFSTTTKNNITKAQYTDYSGLLDLACNPCIFSYEYNEFNLPKKVTYDWGSTDYITYDIIDDVTN